MVKKSSIDAWTSRAKMILGTGETFKSASQLSVNKFKTLIGNPNITDATVKGYQRNLRKMIPKIRNEKHAIIIKQKIEKDLVKADMSKKGVEKLIKDAEKPVKKKKLPDTPPPRKSKKCKRFRNAMKDHFPKPIYGLDLKEIKDRISDWKGQYDYMSDDMQNDFAYDLIDMWRKS